MPDYENSNVLANVDEKDPVYSGIFRPSIPPKQKRSIGSVISRYMGTDWKECIGIQENFTYVTPKGRVLKDNDSKEKYMAVIDELRDTILNYGKADTPEKQQELYNLTADYMRYNERFSYKFKREKSEKSEKLGIKQIQKSENSDILARAYSDIKESLSDHGKRGIRGLLLIATVGAVPYIAAFSFFGLGAGAMAVGLVAATFFVLGNLIPPIAKAVEKIKEIHITNKAKRAIKKDSKEKIKEIKNEIKNLKSKRKEELKNAETKEEKAEIKAKYEKLIDESKQAIAKEKDVIKEKIDNMPKYNDCKYKKYLNHNCDISKVMVHEATKAYNRKHGIEAAAPTAKPKQAEQQVTREKAAVAEHKAERLTGLQQRQKDERAAGMRQ